MDDGTENKMAGTAVFVAVALVLVAAAAAATAKSVFFFSILKLLSLRCCGYVSRTPRLGSKGSAWLHMRGKSPHNTSVGKCGN